MKRAKQTGILMTQRIARGIEIANYLLLIPATFAVVTFLKGPIHYDLELLVFKFAPAIWFVLGLGLHILYFQHARHRTTLVTPQIMWLLSLGYNLILAVYLWNFGSFVTLVLSWPLFIALLSLICLIDTYRRLH